MGDEGRRDEQPGGPRVGVAEPSEPDDREPAAERQAELRAAYAANVAVGAPPYAGVALRTRGELAWVLRERGWDADLDEHAVMYLREEPVAAADLRGVVLRRAGLRGVQLLRADLRGANLIYADLRDAVLVDADLTGARLGRSDLTGANLRFANLGAALLSGATLAGASLAYANLAGARLLRADLRGADVRGARMDPATTLSAAKLDTRTRLGDVVWNGAPLTNIDWTAAGVLGDERPEAEVTTLFGRGAGALDRRDTLEDAARAYRQLAVALRAQGMNEPADRYAYRAQALQRRSLLRRGRLGRWFFSALLDLLAGYGYRPGRSLAAYLLAVGGFALAYFFLGHPGGVTFSPVEALILSMTSFHGRGFFPGGIPLDDPITILAATEAFVGLVIEVSFIATFTQRFLAR